jgi:hypothetical protein
MRSSVRSRLAPPYFQRLANTPLANLVTLCHTKIQAGSPGVASQLSRIGLKRTTEVHGGHTEPCLQFLMIIYGEDLAPTGFTAAELSESGKAHDRWPGIRMPCSNVRRDTSRLSQQNRELKCAPSHGMTLTCYRGSECYRCLQQLECSHGLLLYQAVYQN